jgi:hypothetical protein
VSQPAQAGWAINQAPITLRLGTTAQLGAKHHCDPRIDMLAILVHAPGARHQLTSRNRAWMLANQPPQPGARHLVRPGPDASKPDIPTRCQAPLRPVPDASKPDIPTRCQAPAAIAERECWQISSTRPVPGTS